MPSTTTQQRGGGEVASANETNALIWFGFEEDGVFYGVCLNRYMVATAPSLHDLEDAIVAMRDAHLEASEELGILPFAHLPQAPPEYWDRWLESASKQAPKIIGRPPGETRPPIQFAAAPIAA